LTLYIRLLKNVFVFHTLDVLLSAGKEILLWVFEETWKVACSRKPATDILLAKFEPRSNIFATVGRVTLS
jgi:hypothetical protein